MITFKHTGDFGPTTKFLKAVTNIRFQTILEQLAAEGDVALQRETPKDTRLTSLRWKHEIIISSRGIKIWWTNDNIVDGIPVAILLQYGHGTTGGTFVQGRDYINPAMKPIFDAIAENIWKEVTRL